MAEEMGPVIDGMHAMTARLNAAFSKVEEKDRETARVLVGFVLRSRRRLRDDVTRLEELLGAEVAAEFEAITDDLAAFEAEHCEGFRGRRDRRGIFNSGSWSRSCRRLS